MITAMKKIFLLFTVLSAFAFVACDDDNHSIVLSETEKSFIETKYPGSTVLEVEKTLGGLVEVDIAHDSKRKEVYFNGNSEWVYTEWDILVTELPAAATEAVTARYPDYRIDDVDYVEAPAGDYYAVNIEKVGAEKNLFVTADGVFVE